MSESHAINPMNILLPEDYDTPMCVICQDTLSEYPIYKLPECNHEFHTHCIVTWFRHNNLTGTQLDGRCPCCGNTGINNFSDKIRGVSRWSRGFTEGEKYKFNLILKEAKKPDAPKLLTSLIEKYYKKEKRLKICEQEDKELRKSIKNEFVNYSFINKKRAQIRTRCWNARRAVNELKNDLLFFPIVPIIIPTPIDINS